jgi:hypothetical protein
MSKGKVHPRIGHEGFFKLDARWGGLSTLHPGRFTPGKEPVPIVSETVWAPGPVRTGAENLTPTGIRSPDHPVRSESLYRLRYPGPLYIYIYIYNVPAFVVRGMVHFN